MGSPIDVIGWDEALSRTLAWGQARESRYVCVCNVHSVVTARGDPEFRRVVAAADMATPDGAPIAWMLRRLGYIKQQRINGPDLMWRYLADAARAGVSVYLYGSTQETLARLQGAINEQFPELKLAGLASPPFRDLTAEEDAADVRAINDSGAGVVFVGLGCPKQELWMARHRGRVKAVMIGVGAAFDYHSGSLKRAPRWMQRIGLEWLHRLSSDPRRLWRRYLVTNTVFLIAASRELLMRERG